MTDQHIITIAALGPDAKEMLTLGALCALREAKTLILRTGRHAAAQRLAQEGVVFETLDALYDQCEDFDELCSRAAEELLARGDEGLCYAVSDPASDATVRELARRAGDRLRVVGAGSLRDGAAYAAIPFGVNTENLREITALSTQELRPQADCPQVITEIDNRCLASDVKLWLADLFDDEMTVYFLENAACSPACARPIALCELDRQAHYDHRTAVLVPAVSVYERSRATYEDFVQVVARLRGPGGCPWDRAQTHHTLRQFMIEEACEAAEAMDADDGMKLADELGDVLLQVVLNSAIGAEHRAFDDRDVTSLAAHKMITRHEHVFGRAKAKSAEDVSGIWESAKRRERGEQTPLDRAREVSPLLPALMRAQKVHRRLLGDGARGPALEEVARALDAAKGEGAGERELAALLEACAALAQAMGLDAETALRSRITQRLSRGENENAGAPKG